MASPRSPDPTLKSSYSFERFCPAIRAIAENLDFDPSFRVEPSQIETKWDNGELSKFPAVRIKHLDQVGRADVLLFQDDVGNVHIWTEGAGDGRVLFSSGIGGEAGWRIFSVSVLGASPIV